MFCVRVRVDVIRFINIFWLALSFSFRLLLFFIGVCVCVCVSIAPLFSRIENIKQTFRYASYNKNIQYLGEN